MTAQGIDLAPPNIDMIEGISVEGAAPGMALVFDSNLDLVPGIVGGGAGSDHVAVTVSNATNNPVQLSIGATNQILSSTFNESNLSKALHDAVTVSNASNSGVSLTLGSNQVLSASIVSSNISHDYLGSLSGGIGTNQSHIAYYATKTAAKAATPSIDGGLAYIEENKAIYNYCETCGYTADDDVVLTTGNGGTTRWELLQKMSRNIGDTGWINTDNATLSALNSTTVRLAISSIAAIGIKGIRYHVPIGNYDITLSGTAGPKFIYWDDETLVLKSKDVLWDFNTEVPVSITYWSGTAIVSAPQTEFHGIRDNVWHLWAHRFLGLQYVSGLAFSSSVQTDNNVDPGASETVYNLWSTSGVIQDEDVQSTPGTGQWAQVLGSGLTAATAGIFPFFYYNGSFITTNAAMADRAPFIHAGANTPPQWNNGGTLTAAITGDYIVYHYFATPMTGGWSVFARPHNAKFTSLASALAAVPNQLVWSNYAELKHLYTAVFRVNTGWSNSHRCKLVSLRDFRLTSASPTAAVSPTSHSGLSALELAGAGVTWGHIDDQAQTIAGAKTFSSLTTFSAGTVNGFTYPSADSTTAWQVRKADGTTPVLTVDTTNSNVEVAAKLTAKQASNAVLSAELIADIRDRDFSGDTGNWVGTGWSIGGGTLNFAGGTDAVTFNGFTPTIGKTYVISFGVNTTTAGTLARTCGGVAQNSVGQAVSNITTSMSFIATSDSKLVLTPSAGWVGTVDNVTIKEVTPATNSIDLKDSTGAATSAIVNTASNIGMGIFTPGASYGPLAVSTGGSNNAFGNSLNRNVTGEYNTAVGVALSNNVLGSKNTAIGYQAGLYNQSGNDNVYIGHRVARNVHGGSNNTLVGSDAGRTLNNGSALVYHFSNSVFIGYNTRSYAASQDNEIVIGASAQGAGSNSVVLGNDSITKTILKGNVGIGSTAPYAKLHLKGAGSTGNDLLYFDTGATGDNKNKYLWDARSDTDDLQLSARADNDTYVRTLMSIAHDGTVTIPVISKQSLGDNIGAATEKTTPVDADMVGLMDSAASNVLKKLSWTNIKATLKTYFDTLYGISNTTTSFEGRTVAAVTTSWTASSAALSNLPAGEWLILGAFSCSSTTSLVNVNGAIATNGTNDGTGIVVNGKYGAGPSEGITVQIPYYKYTSNGTNTFYFKALSVGAGLNVSFSAIAIKLSN